MAKNSVFRVYRDDETMLKVYNRRLVIADRIFSKGENQKKAFLDRYGNELDADQVTSRGHRANVTGGVAVIDTMYASMVAVDVEFILRNVGHGTREQALAAERGLNAGWKDTKGQQRAKKAIKDAELVDIGWVKVYYDYVEDTELRDVPEEAIEAQLMEAGVTRDQLTDEMLADLAVEEVPIVLRDRVCVDYVPWDCVRADPSAKETEDVRWVAQYTKLPIEEVRHNPQWRNFVLDRYGEQKGKRLLDDLTGDTTVLTGLEGNYGDLVGLAKDEHGDDQRVTVVELWDFETGLVTTFPHGQHDLILYQRLNPLMFNLDLEDRNPFKPLVLRNDPRKLEGIGDMRLIWSSLEELDEYRTMLSTFVARTVPKFIAAAGAVTDKGKKAMKSQVIGDLIELNEGYTQDAVGTSKFPQLPSEVYQLQERIQFELKDATGASEPMRGVFPSRRTTATETEIVTSAGEQRQAERRGSLEQWYLSIARTMLQLMQVFYDRDRMLRYTDDLGQEFVWTWNNEDIAIDADLDIAITPRENLTRSERVQRAMQWLNLVLPMPETDRGEAIRWAGREMGMRDEDIRAMVKTDQEVQAEQQQEQLAAQLSVRPQPFADSPAGLNIGQGKAK